jgi:hypothetical protein
VTPTGKTRTKASKDFPSSAIEIIHPPGFEDRSFNADLANLDEVLARKVADALKDGVSTAKRDGAVRDFSVYQADLRDATKRGVLGGMQALRSGGVNGLLDYFVQNLANRLEDGLADVFTNLLLGARGGGGGALAP